MATTSILSQQSLSSEPPFAVRRIPRQFNLSAITQTVIGLIALFLVNKGGTAGAAIFFLVLFWIAATSTSGALKALALVGLGVQLNQYFVPKTQLWSPGRLALTAFCCLRIFADAFAGRRIPMSATAVTLTVYCVVAAVCSLLSGYYVQIALLKLVNFWSGAIAILLGTEIVRRRRIDLTPWFVALLLVIIVMGLAAIALGQSRNYQAYRGAGEALGSQLFNGAFLHPNCHSSFAAPAATFLLAATIYGHYRNRWLTGSAAAVMFVFMAISQSRSSIAAALAGVMVLAAYARPVRAFGGRILRVNIRRGPIVATALLALVAIVAVDAGTGGRISSQVFAFINKSGNTQGIDTTDVLKSREGKINESWQNFLESPVYGIGFQVAKTEYFRQQATLFTAPAEKGFLPTAVLEEGGILGAITFSVFLVTFIVTLLRSRNVPALAVCASVLMSTIPEVSIFAMGGAATYMWSLMGAAMIMGDHCWVQRGIQARMFSRD